MPCVFSFRIALLIFDHHRAVFASRIINNAQRDDLALFSSINAREPEGLYLRFLPAAHQIRQNDRIRLTLSIICSWLRRILDVIPNVRVVERRNGSLYQFFLRGFYLFLGWGRHTCAFLRLCENHIFVKAFSSFSATLPADSPTVVSNCFLSRRHLTVQANNTVLQRSQRVFVLCPNATFSISSFMLTVGAFKGLVSGLLGFRHAYGIYDNKMVFILGCGRRNF